VTILTSREKGNPKFAHRLDHFFPPSPFSSRRFCSRVGFNRSILTERAIHKTPDWPSVQDWLHTLAALLARIRRG